MAMDTLSPEQRSRLMSHVRGRDTGPELLIRSMLHRLGYRFRVHRKDLPGTPDLVFPGRRCVLFVHGCFWHGHSCRCGRRPSSNVAFWHEKIDKNKERDKRVQRQLRKSGWQVLAVWECETRDGPVLEKKLTRFLERQIAG
jgi:DNA mismatch endonuclease (patch repair protein)